MDWNVLDRGDDPPIFDPFSYATQDDPYPIYRDFLARAPVCWNPIRGFWTLARYADVQASLRDRTTFSNAEGVNLEDFTRTIPPAGNFLDMDPPRHDFFRRLLHSFEPFTLRGMGRLEDRIQAFATTLLAACTDKDQCDLATEFAHRLPVMVLCEMMGFAQEDGPILKRWSDLVMTRAPDDDRIPDNGARAAEEIRTYLRSVVNQRQGRTSEDLVTLVANATDEGSALAEEEIIGVLFLLFTAGTTTTSDFISNSILVLGNHPQERRRLVAEPGLIPNGVEELLRFESPVQYTTRTTTRETAVRGVTIAQGARVLLLFGAAHRDPDVFDAPDRLDVGRRPTRLLAFGEGIHHCLGAHIARLEAKIALRVLLDLLPNYQVLPGAERNHDSHQRGLARLPVSIKGGA